MGFFLGAHGQGHAVGIVPGTGLLHHMAPVFHQLGLPFHFIFNGTFQRAERVQVFDFRPGAEFRGAFRHDGNVRVAAEAAFLHLAVADVRVFQDRFQLFHVGPCFRGAAHVRFRHDLDQGNARAVVVYRGGIGGADGEAAVHQLARVFFHMDAGDADAFLLAVDPDINMTAQADWFVPLGDLVILRQVGIEVILTVHLIEFLNVAVQRQARPDGKFHHPFVQHRQCSRHAQADGAHVGVGLRAEFRGAGAERFGLCF